MRAVPRAASAWLSESAAGSLLDDGEPHDSVFELPGRATVQRLKTRAQFQAVMAGSTVSRTAHFALHRVALHPSPSPAEGDEVLFAVDGVWVGVILPKRWARRAVTRNAIRRQIYAVCGEHVATMPRAAHVVRLRTGFDRKQFISATSPQLKQAVRAELEQLVRRAAA